MLKTTLPRARALCAAVGLAAAAPLPARAQATDTGERTAAWRADLALLAEELPARHPGFFAHLDPDSFAAAVAALDAALPGLEEHEAAVALARLAAMAGDAHTSVALPAGWPVAPFHFEWFEDGFRAYATGPLHAMLVGARLTAVGDVPVDAAMERIRTVVSHENEGWLRHLGARALRSAPLLHALGLAPTPDSVRYTFAGPGGGPLVVAAAALPPDEDVTWMIGGPPEGPERPLYRRHGELPYWFTVLPEAGAVYLQYNLCREDPERPMAAFADALLAAADSAGATRLVVDLRLNPGGNSMVLAPLLDRLREHGLGADGRMAVLIGRRTMSSAVLNAVALRRLFAPRFYGEPTGGAPNHFGEVKSFTLPATGLEVRHATKFFRQAPEITTPYLPPDVAVPITWEDFAAGRDPVLARALAELAGSR